VVLLSGRTAIVSIQGQRSQANELLDADHDLQVLAAANALQSLAGNRREALWQSVAAVPDHDILADSRIDDETPALGAPSEAEDIVSDYNASGLMLGRHSLSLLRPTLLEQRLMPASTLRNYRNGRLARGCGLVTVRQRPGTAKGVMFVTVFARLR
jgi:error-prone DNA polymerase